MLQLRLADAFDFAIDRGMALAVLARDRWRSDDGWPHPRKGKGALSDEEIESHHYIMRRFVKVWCRDHHAPPDGAPCDECQDLLEYSRRRLEHCPYSPKPKCKECDTPCYKREYRDRVREVMRYSGLYFVKRGRLDWLLRYLLVERRRA